MNIESMIVGQDFDPIASFKTYTFMGQSTADPRPVMGEIAIRNADDTEGLLVISITDVGVELPLSSVLSMLFSQIPEGARVIAYLAMFCGLVSMGDSNVLDAETITQMVEEDDPRLLRVLTCLARFRGQTKLMITRELVGDQGQLEWQFPQLVEPSVQYRLDIMEAESVIHGHQ